MTTEDNSTNEIAINSNGPKGSNGQDRRRSTRYRSSEALVISCEGGSFFTGVTVQISERGLSAMANGLLRVGDAVELEPVAGGQASARVRHKLGQLYGFEFLKISAEQIGRIAEAYRQSNAAMVRRQNS
jgi:PilZ domain